MSVSWDNQYLRGNRLLGVLPDEELERLRPHLEVVAAGFKETLFEPDIPVRHVYFPIDCVASTIATMEDGK